MTRGLVERMLLLFERIGICDRCLARIAAEPDTPLSELFCDRCLAKNHAYMTAGMWQDLAEGDGIIPEFADMDEGSHDN